MISIRYTSLILIAVLMGTGAQASPSNVEIHPQADGSTLVAAERRIEADDPLPTPLRWRVAAGSDHDAAVQRLDENLAEFDRLQRPLRELLLLGGLPDSERVGLSGDGDYIVLPGGEAVSFDRAYEEFRRESARHKHYLRAALEVAAVLGAGSVWYWSNQDFNSVDWEYKFDWRSWRARTYEGTGLRLDSNGINTNIVAHPFSGAAYYAAARSNGFSALESFLFAFAGSTLWEYFAEFREIVSLNDQVFTPVAGAVIGEVFHQLGEFFAAGHGPVSQVLSYVFGGPARFNRWLSNETVARGRSLDEYGFRSDVWHRIELRAGLGTSTASGDGVSASGPIADAGFSMELFTIPGYGAEGVASAFLDQTAYSQLVLRTVFGEDGLDEFLFFVKAAFVGYYAQDLKPSGRDGLRGYSLFVGPSSAFEITHRRGPVTDAMGIVNILGPTIDLTLHRGSLRVRMVIDVYGDFAAIRAFAVDRYELENGLEGVKSVLAAQKYQYAYGLSVSSRVEAKYGPLEAGAAYKGAWLESIEGLDSNEEEAFEDVHGAEKVASLRGWIAYRLPANLSVRVEAERRWRSGSLGTVRASVRENRVLGSVVLTY